MSEVHPHKSAMRTPVDVFVRTVSPVHNVTDVLPASTASRSAYVCLISCFIIAINILYLPKV